LLSLLREMSLNQIKQTWRSGGWRSPHSVDELIERLNPLESIGRVNNTPLLLVYSQRDRVAPAEMGRALQQAAPRARLITTARASHVMLTLIPPVNRQVAEWLREQFNRC